MRPKTADAGTFSSDSERGIGFYLHRKTNQRFQPKKDDDYENKIKNVNRSIFKASFTQHRNTHYSEHSM